MYADDTLNFCLSDGAALIVPITNSEETVVMGSRMSPVVFQPPTVSHPIRQGVNPSFAYFAIGLLALVAGGAIVAWLKSDSTIPTNTSSVTKTDVSAGAATPTQEKPIDIKTQQEPTRTPENAVSQPTRVEQSPSSTVSPQTYRVVGVARNDVLFVRPKPNQLKQFVGKIPPSATNVQVHGNSQRIGKNIWVYVSYEGISGWVNNSFLAAQ